MQRTKAKVVLTSSWRVDPVGILAAKYWKVPFTDVCPDMPKRARSVEIRSWLRRHSNVKRYVVIDDEDDELDELPLFQPSAKTGLTPDIMRGVERYLKGETDEDMRSGPLKRLLQNAEDIFKRDKREASGLAALKRTIRLLLASCFDALHQHGIVTAPRGTDTISCASMLLHP